jgi:tetratricopeptide (TPR) repeat protein
MKKTSCSFAFILLIILGFSNSSTSNEIDSVKEHLSHANSYYWLSRVKNNDVSDLKNMLFHAQSARNILKGLKENPNVEQLKFQAQNAIAEARVQLSEASEAIEKFSPLFPPLVGNDSLLGRYENPDQIAIERSVEGIVGLIKKPSNVSQLYLIIVAEGDDLSAEVIAHEYLNANTSFYAIPRYELSAFLTESEMKALYHLPISNEIIKKICRQYAIKNVGVLRLFQNDKVGQLSYWGADYNYWNAHTGEKGYHCCADGFCETAHPYSGLFWLLILMGFPANLLFNSYNKKFNRDSKGNFAPFWLTPAVGVFSVVVVIMAFKGARAIGIDPALPITSPKGIGWIVGITLILGLLPPILAYLVASRIKQVSAILNNPETVASIVFGSYLGSFTFLAQTAAVNLGAAASLPVVAPALITLLPMSLRLGIAYGRHAISNDEASGIEYLILLGGFLIYTLFVFIWDFELVLAASAGFLVFGFLAASVPVTILKLKKRISEKSEGDEKEGETTGLAWLRTAIKEPFFFCKPWKDDFEKVQKWVTEDDDSQIEVVLIDAPTGCGKTRTAKEIAKRIAEHYREKNFTATILFGDCDEFSQESDVVPYEPFAQALGELLGVGRFSNPAEKADRLKNGLVGVGLKTAMGATGLGALETLLDAGDEGQVVKTNTKEMAHVVAEALTDLSKEKDGRNGKVVFIIDDVQWMDNETLELLKLLFQALEDFIENQVSFIFTYRSDSAHGHDKVKKLIEALEKNKAIKVNRDIHQGLLENEEIVEGILENLNFDFKTKQAFTTHFRAAGIHRPLHILQAIETAIDTEMLEPMADRYVLCKGAKLKRLPPPDDFKRMVEEILSGLDHRIITILQCCAVIGRSFRPSIVAEIFGLDRLELLQLFKEPEERNIIRDVAEEDDIYEFVEKRTVGIFRGLKWASDGEDSVSQLVREYHRRFISLKERDIGIDKDRANIGNASYRDIISLAAHSNAIRDVHPNKVVDYNRLAAERTYARGMFSTAVNYYNNSVEMIKANRTKISPENMVDLYISYAKCLLDEQSDNRKVAEFTRSAFEILKSFDPGNNYDKDRAEIEIRLIEALNDYRNRQFEDSIRKSNEILGNEKASVIQKVRAKFYTAASLPPQEAENRRDVHLEVLAETDKLLKTELSNNERVEILKVKSEAANNTGFVYLHGLNIPEQAIEYFEMAIELNKMDEINDQKGIAISHTGLGDAYMKLNEPGKAEQMYKVNLEISEKSGDLQGICMMNSKLGGIKIETAKKSDGEMCVKLCKEANNLYEKSLATAEDQGNPVNVCFALSGMIESIIASDLYDKADYVLTKIEGIRKKVDLSKAPDFAKSNLRKTLDDLVAKSPELGDKVKAHCEFL